MVELMIVLGLGFFYDGVLLIGEWLTLWVIFCHAVLLSGTIFNHFIACWDGRGQLVCMSSCCVFPGS